MPLVLFALQKIAPPAPTGPKNDFAERLAQRAMANVFKTKPTLQAEGPNGVHSSGSVSSLAGSGSGSADEAAAEGKGPFVKPAHPFGRPRLVLKPRSSGVDQGSNAGSAAASGPSSPRGSVDLGSEMGEKAGAAAGGGPQRPKLQLQPRTQPLAVAVPAANGDAAAAAPDQAGSWDKSKGAAGGRPKLNLLPRSSSGAAADAAAAAKAASVFGAARPREEVLKQRGVDPLAVEAAGQRLSEAALARHGAGARGSSRSGSVVSGEDADWHTVGGRKQRGLGDGGSDAGFGGAGGDPFFGGGGGGSWGGQGGGGYTRGGRYEEREGHGEGYGRQQYSYGGGRGTYGSPGAGGYHGNEQGDLGTGLFSRALPTRHDLIL